MSVVQCQTDLEQRFSGVKFNKDAANTPHIARMTPAQLYKGRLSSRLASTGELG